LPDHAPTATPPPDPLLRSDWRSWDRLRRPIWIYDAVGHRGLYANGPALELWGADSRAELLARDFSQLSPAVLSRLARLAQATMAGETVNERWSFYPRGQPVTVQATISALPLEAGGTALLFEADPVAVEKDELRAVEALRHTSSLISLFDAQGRSTFANPAAFAAYGATGGGFADRFTDPDHGARVFAEVVGGWVMAELSQVRTRAGERSHYLDARRVRDPVTGEVGVLLSERDVTAQVKAERGMRSAQARADLAETKQRFLANVSHELRTPLNSVLGFAALLEVSGLDHSQAQYLTRITQSGQSLLCTINDIIDLSELDSCGPSLASSAFDAVQMLRDVLAAARPAAAAKSLDLVLDIAQPEPVMVIGDGKRLATVVSHLLSNAVKFTDRGRIGLSLTARRSADTTELSIAVTDTGPGLEDVIKSRLFHGFSQGDDGPRKRIGGVGLGLAIARETLALMGGEVGVDSVLGHGARFWLRLSLAHAVPAAASEPIPPLAEDGARALTILYADDHENNRVLVQALLESQGHRCDTVDDGAQAVLAVRRGDYDLVLMDIQMPVQDGVSATVEIREGEAEGAWLPILALTANTLSEQKKSYAAAGLDDCLGKPVDVTELFSKVAYWAAVGDDARAGRSRRASAT
jgi:signal transduction histidine kinase/ActR/RegA family two-component response regulator